MSPALYKKTPLPDIRESSKDAARFLFLTDTAHLLFLFTDHGNCYQLPVSAISDVKPRDRGQAMSALLAALEEGEGLLWATCSTLADLPGEPDYLFFTSAGTVKRTAAAEFAVRTKKTTAIKVREKDRLLFVMPVDGGKDIMMLTESSLCIRFALESVPAQGRGAAGIRGMNVAESDKLIWCGQIGQKDEMILFSDRGFGKRIPAIEFEAQGRGGKGVSAFRLKKNGSNGQRIAGVSLTDEAPCSITVFQSKSAPTTLERDALLVQNKAGAGIPYVMAVLDDVVTGIYAESKVQ